VNNKELGAEGGRTSQGQRGGGLRGGHLTANRKILWPEKKERGTLGKRGGRTKSPRQPSLENTRGGKGESIFQGVTTQYSRRKKHGIA